MVVKRPPRSLAKPAHCWHQVSVRSVKHWPAQARRVNGVLAISVPGSGARAWQPCGHNLARDSLWLYLTSQISSCIRIVHDRSWKVEFCSHNNAMWGGWEYPDCLTFATPLNKPLTSPGSRASENTNKDGGGEEEGDRTGYCPRDCVRSWAHLMELFPDIPGPALAWHQMGRELRDNALSAISLVKTPHCIFVFYENSICLNKFTHLARLISSHTTPTQREFDTIHGTENDFECV